MSWHAWLPETRGPFRSLAVRSFLLPCTARHVAYRARRKETVEKGEFPGKAPPKPGAAPASKPVAKKTASAKLSFADEEEGEEEEDGGRSSDPTPKSDTQAA